MKSETISREQLLPVLVLYHADGEIQKTRLRAFVFLADKDQPNADFYSYRKYDYGPTSSALLQDLQSLDDSDVITIREEPTAGGGKRTTYQLTDFGRNAVSELVSEDDDIEELSECIESVVRPLCEMNIRTMLNKELYARYPEYLEDSVYKI